MLKKANKSYIITLEMRWNLMNQNVLISTALICSMWDKHNKDTLDLMTPFLTYSIAKKTNLGQQLNIGEITDFFKSEFGYETIPHNVILAMLNRLSPEVLSKKQGHFTLVTSLDKDLLDFEKRHTLYKERRNKVGLALSGYLNENVSNLSTPFDCDTALSALIGFFVVKGLVVARTPEQLSLIKKGSSDKVDYCIARFIIDEHKKESEIFDYILDMVKGFFVSTAISFQPENLTLPHSKFKNLRCYLDTRVIIDALGLRLQSGQKAAQELLNMLLAEQATLYCYEHTVTEIRDIIKAYRNSLMNPKGRDTYNTLEHWDEQNYTIEQVNRYLTLLNKKIEALHIEIVPSPARLDSWIKGLKVEKFKKHLKAKVQYHSDSAYENDVLSVMGVMRIRNGYTSTELEKCEHIFVTTNAPLISVLETCLKTAVESVPPVILDTTMSSIVWFKCCNSHKDYPKYKLIENAMLALEPTNTLLKDLYHEVDLLVAEGGITEDEASIIRTDIQLKRELTDVVKGDASLVDRNQIINMKERLRARYIGENKQDVEEHHKRYLEQKAQNEKALTQITIEIENHGEYIKTRAVKLLTKVAFAIWGGLLLLLISFFVAGFVIDQNFWIGAFIILLGNIVSSIDLFAGKRIYVNKFINRIANQLSDKAMEKKREEYQPIVDSLSSTPAQSLEK